MFSATRKKFKKELFSLVSMCYTVSHIKSQYIVLTRNYSKTEKKYYNLVFDVLLGILLFLLFIYTSIVVDSVSYTVVACTQIKYNLEVLIKWLMGAPAGLKLNEELSSFLGYFFLYHVYIWIAYIKIIEDFLPVITHCLTYSSCFGLTMFLSLVNDFVNILTFHIYCFYVYAAKLYRLQLCGLTSLARLFMGKKWNVLRNRVDSIPYEANQQIAGTILFTILLFLLPTTLMYYAVFTLTRLLVLMVQTFIQILVVGLMKLPVHSIWKVHNHDNISCDDVKPTPKYGIDIKEFLMKIITGKLVKPWNKNDLS